MNEQTDLLPSGLPADPAAAPPPIAAERPGKALAVAGLVGFLVLAVAIFLVWQYPNMPPAADDAVAQVRGMDQRLVDLDSRLGRLEQRPAAAASADLAKLASRVDGLDKQVGDPAQLTARLDAVEKRAGDPAQLGARVDALSGRIEALAGRSQTGVDAAKQQIDGLSGRMATLEKASGSLSSISDRLNRLVRLQEAELALSAGKAVGDLPNAPAALAQFAHQAPPTQAQLRLAFPQAERAALAAEQPNEETAPFIGRVWERAQGLVTVRRGDDVVVGNPASVALSHARSALEAGDLTGAVQAVKELKGPPRQALDGWISQATALIGARSALADMAGQV